MIKGFLKKTWETLDDRLGITARARTRDAPPGPRGARWWYVFGSATLCAFVDPGAERRDAAFSYIASSSQAYETLLFITNDAPFGRFLRGLHYYGASAMVLMVGLHMAQVFLAGSYKFPREMNWLTGRVAPRFHARDGVHRAAPPLGPERDVVGRRRRGAGRARAGRREANRALHPRRRHRSAARR
jgi:hypothetical protein